MVTDARYPARWLNDRRIALLSGDAHKLFVTALALSAENRTDGVLYDDDLLLIPAVDHRLAGDLDKAGLWTRVRDRWLIVDFEATQSTRIQLEAAENARRIDRERKAAERLARKAAKQRPADSPTDVQSESTRTGQGKGKGGLDGTDGREHDGAKPNSAEAEWPYTPPPGSGLPPGDDD